MTPHNTSPDPEERRDYIRDRIEAAKRMKEDVANLMELWSLCYPVQTPGEHQFRIWLRRYDRAIVTEAIEGLAGWYENETQMAEAEGKEFVKTMKEVAAYATGIMIRMTERADNGR